MDGMARFATVPPMRRLAAASLVVLAGLTLGACSIDIDVHMHGRHGPPPPGVNGVDRAFAAEMIEHHQMALEMAEIAQDRAKKPQVKALAASIIETQQREIDQLKMAERRLAPGKVEPGGMGLSDSMRGMNMDNSMLRRADPFERMFIDMMIPHHQGAIRMAHVELAKGRDPQLRKLAAAIIAAQSREIVEMNKWRTDWYGKPSPAGGVPGPRGRMDGRMHDRMGGHMEGQMRGHMRGHMMGRMHGGPKEDRMERHMEGHMDHGGM